MSNYTKKPFDLEYMKANPETKLVTRSGQDVTQWHYFDRATESFSLVCIINGERHSFTKEGRYFDNNSESHTDLFMLVPCIVKGKVFYANVYESGFGDTFDSITQAKEVGGYHAIYIVKVTTYEGNPPTFEIVHTY